MSRGFAVVALYQPTRAENVAAVLRAAHAFGAAQVQLVRPRCRGWGNHGANTSKAQRHLPVHVVEELHVPALCTVVGIELVDGAMQLPAYRHPERALYLFGPEQEGFRLEPVASLVNHWVQIPTSYCLNLAACANVVLYDRAAKQL